MAEYEEISPLKTIHHKVQVWLYVAALCMLAALAGVALAYEITAEAIYGVHLL